MFVCFFNHISFVHPSIFCPLFMQVVEETGPNRKPTRHLSSQAKKDAFSQQCLSLLRDSQWDIPVKPLKKCAQEAFRYPTTSDDSFPCGGAASAPPGITTLISWKSLSTATTTRGECCVGFQPLLRASMRSCPHRGGGQTGRFKRPQWGKISFSGYLVQVRKTEHRFWSQPSPIIRQEASFPTIPPPEKSYEGQVQATGCADS